MVSALYLFMDWDPPEALDCRDLTGSTSIRGSEIVWVFLSPFCFLYLLRRQRIVRRAAPVIRRMLRRMRREAATAIVV